MSQMVSAFQLNLGGCLILLALLIPIFLMDKASSQSKKSQKSSSKR